ncbi:CDP-glycerol glycerophosphotransferase family protein [Acrocarpospora phusangensis]|uniref:CDP-glycerol glycerophosphotransferase family protein n=1 Tax=Acrocarpospora phusangensis TaxID=1070424 RepID=UPI001EF28F70|nr:CDP-glycerol glycerophosphotransferase family protein [Acrocarpospora phusangensis]
MVAALCPWPWVFAAACAVSYAAEAKLPKSVAIQLSRVHLGATVRFLTRETAAVLLLARAIGPESRWFALLAAGLFLCHGMRAVQTGLALYLRRCHALKPVESRNLGVVFPAAPPEALLSWRGVRLLYLDVLPVGLTAAGALTGAAWPGALGAGAALLLMAGATLVLLWHVRRVGPLADRRRVIRAVDERVRAYRPEVLLYFSGPADSVYQASMWLPVLAGLDRRAVIVLRERALLGGLGPTTLPVLCIPSAVDMMNFRGLDTARVALFASNVGNNIHMLRTPGLVSVFIGHGDSDKEASFNPFTKVYDEVWVAGPAGRDRYRRAAVGVPDSAIVEVGRPQLAGITGERPATPYRTVLYAPTWEGWTDELFHSSVAAMGPQLVQALLDHSVRLIYKPHPLIGHRCPAARAAHRRVLAVIARAGQPAGRVATDDLYACFNQADLLVSDISSVVADFVASGKPYAVTNVAGRPAADFRERHPTARAAYLLGRELTELPEILAQLDKDEDALTEERRALRGYLLGEGDAMGRFRRAVDNACRRAGRTSGRGPVDRCPPGVAC